VTLRTPSNKNITAEAVERKLYGSARDIALELRPSKLRVLELVFDDQLDPYHLSRIANVFPHYRSLHLLRVVSCFRLILKVIYTTKGFCANFFFQMSETSVCTYQKKTSLLYRNQILNTAYGNKPSLLSEPHEKRKYGVFNV
jgi:hypothetical protein